MRATIATPGEHTVLHDPGLDFDGTHLAIAEVGDLQDIARLDAFHEIEQSFARNAGVIRTHRFTVYRGDHVARAQSGVAGGAARRDACYLNAFNRPRRLVAVDRYAEPRLVGQLDASLHFHHARQPFRRDLGDLARGLGHLLLGHHQAAFDFGLAGLLGAQHFFVCRASDWPANSSVAASETIICLSFITCTPGSKGSPLRLCIAQSEQ